ncbi:YegP family protein [Microlunatus ginsengisoli]|uniref:DUF1508 domain-containing protein n=1 Tax=Microlunatus ginsengisoli TaxID=363863 RepID=A0ABP7AGH4_9ACTN
MAKFEVFQDKAGEYRWRLRHSNGQVIATPGEGFNSKATALNSIESVKKAAAEAETVEA